MSETKQTRRRPPTVRDVAKLAGFSPATVTRALRGDTLVRPETRQRIQVAAAQIGYRPNIVARALVTQRTSALGVIIPEIGDGFWGSIVSGIEQKAAAEGFSVLLASSHDRVEDEAKAVEVLLSNQVDGVIVGSALRRPRDARERLSSTAPTVFVDCDIPFQPADIQAASTLPVATVLSRVLRSQRSAGHPSIAFDDLDASRLVVDHLVCLGHEQIGFVGGAPVRSSLLRLLGLRSALEAQGGSLSAVIDCARTLQAGLDAGTALLSRADRPTAIVAYDDLVAIGVVRAAHAHGLSVPHDVSVVGFDDIEVASYVEPPLTTVRQPTRRMGNLAVELVLSQLRGEEPDAWHLLPGELVERESTGSPKQLTHMPGA